FRQNVDRERAALNGTADAADLSLHRGTVDLQDGALAHRDLSLLTFFDTQLRFQRIEPRDAGDDRADGQALAFFHFDLLQHAVDAGGHVQLVDEVLTERDALRRLGMQRRLRV